MVSTAVWLTRPTNLRGRSAVGQRGVQQGPGDEDPPERRESVGQAREWDGQQDEDPGEAALVDDRPVGQEHHERPRR